MHPVCVMAQCLACSCRARTVHACTSDKKLRDIHRMHACILRFHSWVQPGLVDYQWWSSIIRHTPARGASIQPMSLLSSMGMLHFQGVI